jgi:hypothetical protein
MIVKNTNLKCNNKHVDYGLIEYTAMSYDEIN